jgi:hypothetical protein
MEAPQLDAKINSYIKKIQKLDSQAESLPKEKLTEYQATKNRFEQRLKAWQRTLGSDLAVFNSNISEGYYELEAQLLAAKNK